MPRNTKNKNRCVPSATQWCKKGAEGLGTSNSWIRVWYLGESKKMHHEGRRLGVFQLDIKESAHLGKRTKGKVAKMWVWKGWCLEALGKERLEVSPLGPPKTGKSARSLLKREPQKRKIVRKWGRVQPPMLLTQYWFGYLGQQMEGNNGTPKNSKVAL